MFQRNTPKFLEQLTVHIAYWEVVPHEVYVLDDTVFQFKTHFQLAHTFNAALLHQRIAGVLAKDKGIRVILLFYLFDTLDVFLRQHLLLVADGLEGKSLELVQRQVGIVFQQGNALAHTQDALRQQLGS